MSPGSWKPKLAGLAAILALVGLFAAVRFVEVYRRSAMTYRLKAAYQSLPADSKGLRDWIGRLPGIRSAQVVQDGHAIRIEFRLSDPQPPDPLGQALRQAESLGYRGCRDYVGEFSRIRAYDFSTLRVEHGTMPADDAILAARLGSNPTLARSNVAREGNVLTIEFAVKDPPIPDAPARILDECRGLGYGHRKGYFSGFGPYR